MSSYRAMLMTAVAVPIAFGVAATPAWSQQQTDPVATPEDRTRAVNSPSNVAASPGQDEDASLTSDQGVPGDGIASGDIIVTATRDSTLLSRTPVAITAVTGDSLIETGVTNPTQIGELVPNVSIDRANGLQITIRGISSADGSEKGDPSAAFMLDGIYIARPQAQETSFFDIGRVEVLRGPQGTLFGRNTTAGVVNVITNRPSFTLGGRVDTAYGNYNQLQTTAVVNLPVTDTVAVRAAVNYDRRDNFIRTGPRLNADLDPFKDNISGRLTALFNLGDGEILLRGDYTHMGGKVPNAVQTGNFYQNFNTPGVTPTYIGQRFSSRQLRTLNLPASSEIDRDNTSWGVQGEATYDFGGFGVAYLGSYREFKRREGGLSLLTNNTAAVANRFDGDQWQNSQELRVFTSGEGLIKAQAGVYYFKERSAVNFFLIGRLSPTPGTVGYIFGFPQDPTIAESWAGYGQATLNLSSRLRVTGGVRYSRDDKSRQGATVRCGTVACNQPGDVISRNDAQRVFDKVTWRAGVDADIGTRTLAYATVSTGYKAGGFNDGCLATSAGCNNPLPDGALFYEPETLTAYEIGLKTRFLDNALRTNLAAFHYDYSNIQLSQVTDVCGGPCTITTNAARADVSGVELETTIQPVRTTLFNVAVSYLDAEYARFAVTPTVNFAGRDLDRSPGITVIAGFTQTFDLGNGGNIEANVRTRVLDDYFLATLSTATQFRVPSSVRSDINLTYNAPNDRYYVQGFVKNVEDQVVVTTANTGNTAAVLFADPRTYGVRAGFKF